MGRPVRSTHRFFAHRHDFDELALVLEGSCRWTLGGNTALAARAGDLVLVPAGRLHREVVPPGERVRLAWVGFANAGPAAEASVWAAGPWRDDLARLFALVFEEMHASLPGARERAECVLGEILVLAVRAAVPAESRWGGAHDPSGPGARSRRVALARSAARYFGEHGAAPLRIGELARYHSLSPSHFAAVFRSEVGESPSRFRQRCRLERAQALLRDPRLSVKQVAAACGFADAAHLCHRFKAATGATPRAWRQAHAARGTSS
jgi:AraC-like DNA-binding protein